MLRLTIAEGSGTAVPCSAGISSMIFSEGSHSFILEVRILTSIGFATKSFIPDSAKSFLASSMAFAERAMITGFLGSVPFFLMAFVASTPSTSGIIWSIKIMS